MKSFKKICLFLFVFTLTQLPLSSLTWATTYQISHNFPVQPMDPSKLPILEPEPGTPIGFILDGNDLMEFVYEQSFKFQLSGSPQQEIAAGEIFHLELRPLGNAPIQPGLFAVRVLAPGIFQFQVRSFDPNDFELILSHGPADGSAPLVETKLDSEEKFWLSGSLLESVRYPGDTQPIPSGGTVNVLSLNDPKILYMFEVEGPLTLWAHPSVSFQFPDPGTGFSLPDLPEATPPVTGGNPPPTTGSTTPPVAIFSKFSPFYLALCPAPYVRSILQHRNLARCL